MSPTEYRHVSQLRADVAEAMTEAQFERWVERTAEALGWLVYHTHRSDRSQAGFPDVVMLRNGRQVVAELKRQARRAKPTAQQELWLAEFRKVTGAEVYLWRPADMDRIEELLA